MQKPFENLGPPTWECIHICFYVELDDFIVEPVQTLERVDISGGGYRHHDQYHPKTDLSDGDVEGLHQVLMIRV